MDNLHIYEMSRKVPNEAKKPISAGRLKGMTDINPMWRIKKLTELFGPCGIGWWYVIKDKHLAVDEETQQVAAFVDIELYYISDGKVSMPVPGTGGSMFVSKESKGFYTDDECYKKALTDAISVAAKALGIGADVYWDKDRSKYSPRENSEEAPKNRAPKQDYSSGAFAPKCAECDDDITVQEHDFSAKKYGRPLCRRCQQAANSSEAENKPKAYRCEKCGEDIKPYASPKNGKTVTVDAHVARSVERYKATLCLKCAMEKEAALQRVEEYGKQLAGEAQ